MLLSRTRVAVALVARRASSIVRPVGLPLARTFSAAATQDDEGWQRDEQGDSPIQTNELSLSWTMSELLASQADTGGIGTMRDECCHVPADTSVFDATRAMLETGCGAIIVENNETHELIGHLRKAALMQNVIMREKDPHRTSVGEVLSEVEYPPSMRLTTHNCIMDALRVISRHRVSHGLPVYDAAQKMVGYVPLRNLLKAARHDNHLRCSFSSNKKIGPPCETYFHSTRLRPHVSAPPLTPWQVVQESSVELDEVSCYISGGDYAKGCQTELPAGHTNSQWPKTTITKEEQLVEERGSAPTAAGGAVDGPPAAGGGGGR